MNNYHKVIFAYVDGGTRKSNLCHKFTDHDYKSQTYLMESKERGLGIIITNLKFYNRKESEKVREGAENDIPRLDALLKSLGFKTTILQNLKKDKMCKKLEKVAKEDHSKFHCLVVAISTHGSNNFRIFGADDEYVSIIELMELFNGQKCPSLLGKPKIFIVQACAGRKENTAVLSYSSDGDEIQGLNYFL